ncbi:putative peptidoglycan binding protein [Geodermatophilus normandii]|uniref:Putative peptidoglycan binding protein n=2 Tax=Geodermatophilus normandii TaxID=1137989 RepID=A0A317QQ93_9ACTN|nr:putative peptidoglycan binding protein [Geodermatophilus normandii]
MQVPDGLPELARILADRAHDDARELEELELRILYDSDKARDLLRDLYNSADKEHDLGRCRAILDVLDVAARRPVFDRSLVALRTEYATYLAARTKWAKDYYRSALYTPRQTVEAVLEELLGGRPGRMLQLYADGGMGKSTQLRWFVARRCVPARLPAARVDFDDVHPVAATRHPWLLLIEAAAQLDQQITGLPFQELLATYGHYGALLTRHPAADFGIAPRHASRGEGEDVRERFVAALLSRPGNRPAVLVLDTIEKVLHRSVDPTGIVELLSEVVHRVPALRVVLAGRFDLRERMSANLPELASHHLQRLTPDEEHHYLVDIRGLQEDIVQQVRKLAQGRPLTLATYADLISRLDDVSADELAGWRTPGLLAAIERYVDRIEDDRVHWLLRYGVIPRRLRYDFVVSVMWRPFMSDAMTGKGTWDDPQQDDRPRPRARARATFRTDLVAPETEAQVRDLWTTLLDYTSDYGWISLAADESDAVQIRPDVLDPLRHLIRPHPVFAELQRAAGDYFEQRAAGDPEHWLDWTREAVFHRFQFSTEAGMGTWRAALEQARAAYRYDDCLELATEILGEDYVDRLVQPIGSMTYEALASAHLERARSAAALADQNLAGREDPLWREVEAGLGAARAQQAARPEIRFPVATAVTIEARLALAQGDATRSERLLRRAQDDLEPSRDLADLERALGQALLNSRGPDAIAHLLRSYEIALSERDLPGARQSVMALARAYARNDDYAAAVSVFGRARQDGFRVDTDADLRLLEAHLLLQAGSVNRAIQAVEQLSFGGVAVRVQAPLVLALARLRVDDFVGVFAATDGALDSADLSAQGVDARDVTLGLRGMAYAALLDADRGAADLMEAAARVRELSDYDSAAMYCARAALVLTTVSGKLLEAAQVLEEAQRTQPESGSRAWLRTRLATARLRQAMGDEGDAQAILRDALNTMRRAAASPGDLVEAGLHYLSVASPGDHEELVVGLVVNLQRVTPPRARLRRLENLGELPRLQLPEPQVRLLRALLIDDLDLGGTGSDLSTAERTALEWRVAEILRVVGRPQEAGRYLDSALAGRGDLLGWWWWLDGMGRLGPPTADEPTPSAALLRRPPRTLAIACQVALAERRLDLDPLDQVVTRLDAADQLRSGLGTDQWTARIAMVRAEVARRKGDELAARRHAAEATAVYSQLGDSRRRDEVAGRFQLGGEGHVDEGGTIEVRFGPLSGQSLNISVLRPEGERTDQTVSTREFGDAEDSSQALSRLRTILGSLAHGWRAWSEQVAEHLLPNELRKALTVTNGPRRQVRLVFDSRDSAALPWELIRAWDADVPLVQGPDIEFVYRSLTQPLRDEAKTRTLQKLLRRLGHFAGVPDGLRGPSTDQAICDFHEAAGIAVRADTGTETWSALRRQVLAEVPRHSLRAVVLRPGREREAGRQRGYAAAGQEPVAAYRQHRIELVTVEDPQPDALTEFGGLFKEGTPDLLHVMAPVRLTTGATVLEFGETGEQLSRRGQLTSNMLSVSALGALCTVLGSGAKLPLILLDVPLPYSPLEATRHLAIRNSMAHQLLKLGCAEAVLAMGLAEPPDQAQILDQVLAGLTEGKDIAIVTSQLQRFRPPDDFAGTLACAGSALFLERPPMSLLPLGY